MGKLVMPESILQKPGPLTPEEASLMRRHPEIAFEVLKNCSCLSTAAEMAYCHHEAIDGSGYPRGLKGEDIPIQARILTLVDCYDAMRSPRVYQPPLSRATALQEVRSQNGIQFDSRVVTYFLEVVDQLEEAGQWSDSMKHPDQT
jgi:HD-GYP domain-containing protein (c-di-GMP phosphodiesterase class II)